MAKPAPLHPPMRVAVLTVSDRCSRGETEDTTGPAVAALCRVALDAEVVATQCVPDEVEAIRGAILGWADAGNTPTPRERLDLILTAGGTGLAPRDVTPEATAPLLERRHPALLELARLRCYEITPRTFLSRGEAGTVGQTLVINLPGSKRGATEMLAAVADILPHAIDTLRGDVQDDGRPDAEPSTGKVVRHSD
ncbi:MogA/MoaB family molybdenum cofactor biosynthesis protein [Phycisphaeraceae bacterium D3-23]